MQCASIAIIIANLPYADATVYRICIFYGVTNDACATIMIIIPNLQQMQLHTAMLTSDKMLISS